MKWFEWWIFRPKPMPVIEPYKPTGAWTEAAEAERWNRYQEFKADRYVEDLRRRVNDAFDESYRLARDGEIIEREVLRASWEAMTEAVVRRRTMARLKELSCTA